MEAVRSPGQEFYAGIRAELPILVGVSPFGIIYGVLAISAGLQPFPAQAMSAVVFAGSSQFILTQMVSSGASAFLMIVTVAVVNLRHMLYSASLAPYLHHLPARWKILLSYLLTDEAYAVSVLHFQQESQISSSWAGHWFLFGAGFALWSCWQLSTAVGILLGSIIPSKWSLDFTLALTFIALLIPTMKTRPNTLAALVAALVAVIAYPLPYKLGLVLAAISGIFTGLWLEQRK